jgi:hypothetical protein
MGTASFNVFKRMGLSLYLQCFTVHILSSCRFFVGFHSAVYMWGILFSWRNFSCNSTVAVTCYELPTPLQNLCCSEIKSGKQWNFFRSFANTKKDGSSVCVVHGSRSFTKNELPAWRYFFLCCQPKEYLKSCSWLQLVVPNQAVCLLSTPCAFVVILWTRIFPTCLSSVMDKSSVRGFDTLRHWISRQ